MYLNRQMPLRLIFRWTRKSTALFMFNASIPVLLHVVFGLNVLTIPWSMVAIVGTAVAFLISFQNNAAYDRVWEARKIWGGIVNETRTFSMYIRDMVEDPAAVKTLLYRHRAWLTALRFAMREQKSWEIPQVTDPEIIKRFNKLRYNPERVETIEDSLRPLLSEEEFNKVMASPNKQGAILFLQSAHLKQLKANEKIWGFSFLQVEDVLRQLFTLQGKSERIKNFPYPRQYFTLGVHLTWVFILLLPYAMIPEFYEIGHKIAKTYPIDVNWFAAASIPFVACVSWVFHTMGRMGRAGENPFEGTIHDVPISGISRTLKIEISHVLGENEDQRPKPFPIVSAVQM